MYTKFYLHIALPVPLRQTFTYLPVKGSNQSQYVVGARVQVPFGKRNLIGVIVAITNNLDDQSSLRPLDLKKLKNIHRLIDDENILPYGILELSNFAASYYQHAIGEVYFAGLPKPIRQGKELENFHNKIVLLNTDGEFLLTQKKLSKAQNKLIQLLLDNSGRLSLFSLIHLGVSSATINSMLKNKQLHLEHTDLTDAYQTGLTNTTNNNLLKEKSLILNNEQNIAVNNISAKLSEFNGVLLYGITGSGKTEVYLNIIHQVLLCQRQILVLVPEISLTPQTISRFENRFNVKISVIHSKINLTNKTQDWLAAKNGGSKIIIGTRSAIFTPIKDLGLIIVDEEHDLSFKQQDGFKYNARDLAVVRAQKLNIPIILGSATPSVESMANVITHKYELSTLTHRAGEATLPKIKLLNTTQKQLTSGLSKELITNIKNTLEKKQQVLLFLNRRGYAPVIKCQDCNWSGICERCNVHYTVHRENRKLICHYCMTIKQLPSNCLACGSIDLQSFGVGTEQIEHYIKQVFPNYPAIRIDRDTTQNKNSFKDYLKQIHQNKPMVLMGTQMLAKGHDFPYVTLVAILDVDSSLFSTDFRAAERITQLILQVAGRAGRGKYCGEVIIQTSQPEHPVLQDILHKNYYDIATELYRLRKMLGQPPCAAWALMRAESFSLEKTMDFLAGIKLQSNKILQAYDLLSSVQVLGPITAPRTKKAGVYRGQLLLASSSRNNLHKFVRLLLQELEQTKIHSIRWTIDVDPQDIY